MFKISIINLINEPEEETRQAILDRALCREMEFSNERNSFVIFDNVFEVIEPLYRCLIALSVGNAKIFRLYGSEDPYQLRLRMSESMTIEITPEKNSHPRSETLSCAPGEIFVALHSVMFDLYVISERQGDFPGESLPEMFALDGFGLLEETFKSVLRQHGPTDIKSED